MKYLFYISILFLALSSCTRETQEVKKEIVNEGLYLKEGIRINSSNDMAPDFVLKNLEGKDVTLSDYKGKVVFINFWAKWCGPCVQEMPSIDRLGKAVSGSDIVVLIINIGESEEVIGKFITDNGYSLETLLDKHKSVSSKYGVRSIPSTYIINKKGEIVGTKIGSHEWDSQGVIDILKGLAAE